MASPPRLRPGMIFAREFRVVRPLAEGGMGAVYVAEQLSTAHERALKVMHPDLLADPKARERFVLEARVGAKIPSEHVVAVVDAGIDAASGTPWLAMELLDGESLEALTRRLGRLPPGAVLEVFQQACHAVAAAHRAGIVHRDLKPDNLFVARARQQGVAFVLKVLDFGIAKLLQEGVRAVTTSVVGSPVWMPPEQRDMARAVGPAADVWTLGLVAFRCLTGLHYWPSANAPEINAGTLLREILADPLAPASARAAQFGRGDAVPPGFDAWFAGCVARDPAHRFPDAAAMMAALAPVLASAAHARGGAPFAPWASAVAATVAVPAPPARGPSPVPSPARSSVPPTIAMAVVPQTPTAPMAPRAQGPLSPVALPATRVFPATARSRRWWPIVVALLLVSAGAAAAAWAWSREYELDLKWP